MTTKKIIGNTNAASDYVDVVLHNKTKKPTKRTTNLSTKNVQKVIDEWEELEIPHLRCGEFHWNFEKPKMPLVDKITWALTAVNVAILISLVIKNLN